MRTRIDSTEETGAAEGKTGPCVERESGSQLQYGRPPGNSGKVTVGLRAHGSVAFIETMSNSCAYDTMTGNGSGSSGYPEKFNPANGIGAARSHRSTWPVEKDKCTHCGSRHAIDAG